MSTDARDLRRRMRMALLLGSGTSMLAILLTAGEARGDQPLHAHGLSAMNRLGRSLGIGYSDGYHNSAWRAPRIAGDRPPRPSWALHSRQMHGRETYSQPVYPTYETYPAQSVPLPSDIVPPAILEPNAPDTVPLAPNDLMPPAPSEAARPRDAEPSVLVPEESSAVDAGSQEIEMPAEQADAGQADADGLIGTAAEASPSDHAAEEPKEPKGDADGGVLESEDAASPAGGELLWPAGSDPLDAFGDEPLGAAMTPWRPLPIITASQRVAAVPGSKRQPTRLPPLPHVSR